MLLATYHSLLTAYCLLLTTCLRRLGQAAEACRGRLHMLLASYHSLPTTTRLRRLGHEAEVKGLGQVTRHLTFYSSCLLYACYSPAQVRAGGGGEVGQDTCYLLV